MPFTSGGTSEFALSGSKMDFFGKLVGSSVETELDLLTRSILADEELQPTQKNNTKANNSFLKINCHLIFISWFLKLFSRSPSPSKMNQKTTQIPGEHLKSHQPSPGKAWNDRVKST